MNFRTVLNMEFYVFATVIVFAEIQTLSSPMKLEENKDSESYENILHSFSSLFHHQDSKCFCTQNICNCYENMGNVSMSINYFEFYDLQPVFGINISTSGKTFTSARVNVANLPCLKLPYIKNSSSICLQLYGFNKTDKYVQVSFDLKAKFIYSSSDVPLGCLLIPRLHPNNQNNEPVDYRTLLKKMQITKVPNDANGFKLCSSPTFSPSPSSASILKLSTICFLMFLILLK